MFSVGVVLKKNNKIKDNKKKFYSLFWVTLCYTKTNIYRRWDTMLATKKIETATESYSINDAMNVLLSKLDEAIDDLENGRVLTEEELWEEIDSI